ncbi:MAG: chromate transporter [Acidobacteriaceae bacterium]|jgi:chromate transporter|nr:chromate transporter [Acidobacteriaceae bacterium]
MERRRVGAMTVLFLRSGGLTLGGGTSIQAVLQREMVERRGWLSEAEFGLIYGLARFTPGTNVLACTAALGWRLGGWGAAVAGVLAVSVPASLVVLGLVNGYERVRAVAWVAAAVGGALAAVVALIAVSSAKLVRPYAARGRWVRIGVLTGGAAVALGAGWLSPVAILVVAVGVGLALDRMGVA